MKFKEGDKVRIIKNSRFYREYSYDISNPSDQIGTVIADKPKIGRTFPFNVKWLKVANWYEEIDLEHARIKNTKIARKMNPTYKEEGKWLLIQ